MDSPFYRLKRGATRPPPDRVGAASPFRARTRTSALAPCTGDGQTRRRWLTFKAGQGIAGFELCSNLFPPPAAATALKISDRRCAVEEFAGNLNFDVEEVLAHARCIDVDAKARRLGRSNLTVAVALELVGGERLRQWLWRRRVLAQPMLGETRIGLQRGRQGQMRGEGVIDVGDATLARIVGNPL